MRIRNFSGAKEILENSPILIKNPEQFKGNFKSLFQNNNPIYLEIGMGKGTFLLKNALENPQNNYIGIEKYDTIIARAIQKISEVIPPNLKIIKMDAINLENVFNHEIKAIYLNFSDPWPKKRHETRRLTSQKFLKIYDNLFESSGKIIQKTDNLRLFESSIISLSTYGYTINELSFDLANTDIPNITTEYEEKFIKMGTKINYLKAEKE